VEVILNIDSKCVATAMTNKEPKDVCETLKSMHRIKSTASQHTLRRRVLSLRMKPEQSIRSYVNSIYEIENELSLTGHELSDEDKVFALLESLRDDYGMLKTILQKNAELEFEEMVSRLELREEIERKGPCSEESPRDRKGSSFVAGSHSRHRRADTRKCHICDKPGHIARECFFNPDSASHKRIERWKQRNKSGASSSGKANFAFKGTEDEMDNKWFPDSCASQHITNQKHLMYEYHPVETGRSIMTAEKKVQMKIEGYRKVRLQQEIEGDVKTIELKNFAYMPSIRTNLMSV